jgi:hypothetical protein
MINSVLIVLILAFFSDVKTALSEDIMKTILSHYEKRLSEVNGDALTQAIALQLIFDVQLAAALLVGRNNSVCTFPTKK